MNLSRHALANPWFVVALTLLVLLVGGREFATRKTELFPDTVPPQVALLALQPGASAPDVKRNVTVPLEKELSTVPGLKTLRSTSRDGASSLQLEFEYGKPVAEAVLDVQNAVSRVRAELPADVLDPRIYPVTDATPPVLTLALSPAEGSALSLSDIRLLADNDLRERLQRVPGVEDAQVFGGHEKEIRVLLDPERLRAFAVPPAEVARALRDANLSVPSGVLLSRDGELQVSARSEFRDPREIEDAVIRRQGDGFLRVGDVGRVIEAEKDARGFYRGNWRSSVGIAIQRARGGNTLETIARVKAELADLRREYPGVAFEIASDQQPVIDRNSAGMKDALGSSVLFTMIILLLFLGQARAALLVLVSIPASFLFAMIALKFTDYSLNMVTLSGLIIATGMVVDATVVVLENIDRRRKEQPAAPFATVVAEAVREIDLSIFSGTLTTVVALIPVMYVGGYPQTVLRPLTFVLSSALAGSYLVAVTVVPLLALHLLDRPSGAPGPLSALLFAPVSRMIARLEDLYAGLLAAALGRRVLVLLALLLLFAATLRTIPPLLGQELMPPMDTGIVHVKLTYPSDAGIEAIERSVGEIEQAILRSAQVTMVSTVAGSEPGKLAFGGGGQTLQQVTMTVTLTTRDRRAETIWQFIAAWRENLAVRAELKSFQVAEFGATPISTTQAPVVLTLKGRRTEELDALGERIRARLGAIRGLQDLQRSWQIDRPELRLRIDPLRARVHGLTPAAVAEQARFAVGGLNAGGLKLEGFLDLPIRVRLEGLTDRARLESLDIHAADGMIPLRSLARFEETREADLITREDGEQTLDLTGYNRGRTVLHVAADLKEFLAGLDLPDGYRMELAGTSADMADTGARLLSALLVSALLVYLVLVWSFNSFALPVPVLAAVPLALIGGLAGMLLMDKPMCMPAMMGIILLAGTVINNSIFLVDFTQAARARGMGLDAALLQSVRARLRPILMTTVSTIVGMAPLILERAVGLERMSPLGTVAAFGLAAGTVMTLVASPVILSLLGGRGAAAGSGR